MSSIVITGKKRGFSFKDACGEISIDGKKLYEGKGGPYGSLEITDSEHNLILKGEWESASRWHTFLGRGSFVMKDSRGTKILQIRLHSLFGLTRTLEINGEIFHYRERKTLQFPGATFTVDWRHRSVKAEVFDETWQLPSVGFAFRLYLAAIDR